MAVLRQSCQSRERTLPFRCKPGRARTPMKIVLANRYFYPDQSATSRMVSSLAFSLAGQGHSVTALASRHFHDRRDAVLPARETINGVSVRRLWTSGFGRSGLAGRAVDYGTFHMSAALWWLLNTGRKDVCVVCTDPPLLAVTGAMPIALRGGRLVNWVMDLFPETATELGLLSQGAPSGKISLLLRDWSLKRAALTICPMQEMNRYLASRTPGVSQFTTVHHWSDGEEIHPVHPEHNRLRREWGLEGTFVVGYSGNFGRAHEFDTLINAAEKLRGHDHVRFLLIGDGQRRAATEREVRRRGLSNVLFKSYQPSELLAQSLSAADVHIVSLLPELEYCIVPSKFYGVLAAGRPTIFIGDLDGEVATVVRRAACGESVAPGDADGLAGLILRLESELTERLAMGRRARQLLEIEYGRDHGVDRWQEAVSHLLTQEQPTRVSPRPQEVRM